MSGHNKWSKIKKGKEIKDKQKSSVFSKLTRIITLAVIEGGGITDPENNIKLRLAIEKAKNLNFPKDNIERAVEKGAGPNSQQLKEIIYEGFGPGGVALIILTATDNANRVLGEIRSALEIHGGKLGRQGSAVHFFKKNDWASYEAYSLLEISDENTAKKLLDLIEALENLEDVHKVFTNTTPQSK
ncbi:hypothetical protein A2767_03455 [Candidatus Roizmanbacteria bacterium RIFCSPHIGHO2_01_FULL_35_10]|uniref:Transcriptional regulator n=1 Tax=Candidatus Roizmanbacteria bacterium RIFCSPLOWO2_01_FULL_35_13 TaxID=1802055 RepID=A0A1F7IER6_9BACT|nr:MAG: hypothetical protein A2767_03455 [Candidatus Roizmanbacteria bacterium RIFCSPHIGHO2_01_FULL_35_10]OGK41859.1 MAG: hypothetical protein A3A74_02490 [Candidatus Roizmanbacteria bacterium RIFCSPLOWO2_01_FULL_35_13]